MGIWGSISNWLGFGATLGSDSDIYGGAGDDFLTGKDIGELISGQDGNDWIRGNGGIDRIFGGNGNDLIEGGSGNDLIDGGAGIDTASYFNSTHGVIANLEFGTASTLGAGPEDNDTLVSIENLTGSFYADHLQGNEGANVIEGMAGNDALLGWGGNDTLSGGFGVDAIAGGDGNDRLSGGFDNDQLFGNTGIDTADYFYAYEAMYISLAEGLSRVRFASSTIDNDSLSGIENVTGSQFNDLIEGSVGANVIDGGLGIDTVSYRHSGNGVGVALYANTGTLGDAFGDSYISIENIEGSDSAAGDVLAGNDDANVINGLLGNDVLYGRGGNDTLIGGEGNDYAEGGDGNDLVFGGEGANVMDGGNGFDTANFSPSHGGIGPIGPGVTVDLTAGTASGLGMDGTTLKNFEHVRATAFDDTIAGNALANDLYGLGNADTLQGRGGNDNLLGGEGSDKLLGGTGNDILYGENGADTLTGGQGTDFFVFTALTHSGTTAATRDLITDFELGDRISLSVMDANPGLAGDQAFAFIGGSAFTGAAGELRAVAGAANTLVEADLDGNGVADFQIRLTGSLTLSAADFVL